MQNGGCLVSVWVVGCSLGAPLGFCYILGGLFRMEASDHWKLVVFYLKENEKASQECAINLRKAAKLAMLLKHHLENKQN